MRITGATYLGTLLVYMGLIVLLSLVRDPVQVNVFRYGDKLNHFIAYALMGVLWVGVLRSYLPGGADKRPLSLAVMALVACFVFGGVLEVLQHLTNTRHLDPVDAAANGAGGFAGGLIFARLAGRRAG